MVYQIRCNNCLAAEWYIIQDELLWSIKEMKVRKSQSLFWKRNADGTLHYTKTYVYFQSLYIILFLLSMQGHIQVRSGFDPDCYLGQGCWPGFNPVCTISVIIWCVILIIM